jgi:predicted Fe-S protein YdhL (DUF1289 family)
VPRERVLGALEDLKSAGASSVLVLPVEKDAGLNGTRSLMRIFDWKSLSAAEQRSALQRPAQRDAKGVAAAAQDIIDKVRSEGDAALLRIDRALRRRSLEPTCR